ncbi:ATP-binding protein [Frigoribacterium salinisoli]
MTDPTSASGPELADDVRDQRTRADAEAPALDADLDGDAEPDLGMFHPGQYRIELVQLLNWGSYAGLHRMPVGRGGIAILGPTGRGKSTVLDAMSAVIMPNPQEFNRAARDDSRQRSERTVYSYARGKTDEVREAASDRTTTRFLRPLGQAFASGAAITWSTELGETVTAVRVAWIAADTAGQDEVTQASVYLLVRGRFDLSRLTELGRDATSSSPITKASLSRLVDPARDLVTWSQPELRVQLCSTLGIGGSDESQLKALTLLRRAQASKGVFSIDELFKQFVLTQPKALSRWETTLATYREASQLYDVFETTRKKLDVLRDVPDLAARWEAAGSDAAAERALLRGAGEGAGGASGSGGSATGSVTGTSRLRVWLAEKVGDWVSGEVGRVLDAKRTATDERRSAVADEEVALRSRETALVQLAEAGGDPSGSLREQLAGAQRELALVDREHGRLAAVLGAVDVPVPTSEDEVAALRARAVSLAEEEAAARRAGEEERTELAARIAAARQAVAAKQREKQSFEQRRSNVPDEAVERRRRIAEGAGVPLADLPYAGELFEVAPEHQGWAVAVERVLGDVATHLLVGRDDFAAVRRFVDEHDMRGRVTVVPVTASLAPSRTAIEGTVPSMLVLDDAHPYAGWLHDELVDDRSVLCVEAPAELDQPLPAGVRGAVTRRGLRTASRQRVVKDDRAGRSWIGLDNASRVQELEAEVDALMGELDRAREAWDAAEQESTARRRVLEALRRAGEVSWEDVDRGPAAARVALLQEQLDRLSQERPEIAELQAAMRRHDDERVAAAQRKAAAEAELARLEEEHGRLVDMEDLFADALAEAEASPLTPEERALLAPLPFAAPRGVADLERAHREAVEQLRGRIAVHEREREQHEAMLELVFSRYLELDPNAGVDATIDSLPAVLAIHRGLVEDDLPHAEQDWLAQAGASVGDSLRALLVQIEEDGHVIRRGVRPISEALRAIEFRQGSTLDIEPLAVTNSDLQEFRRTLRAHTAADAGAAGAAAADPAAVERRFLALRRDLAQLEERSQAGEAWRRRVLDAREHYQFRAIETRADGTQIVHEGVAGKSGGEGQELIAFVLGAALRFRLGDGTDRVPTYAPIVLDEGFVKADTEYTGRALSALRSLGFQLVVGAPRDKVNAFEQHVDSVAYISSDPSDPELSRIYPLTIREAMEVERHGLEPALLG